MSLGSPKGRLLLIEDIKKRVAQGKECMVLATCRYMLSSLLATMKSRGVPFHNPYRVTEGPWNPMRGGTERLSRFLSLFCEGPQGEIKSAWTWLDIHRWSEPLMAKSFLRHGAVKEIERQAKKHADTIPVSESELRLLLQPGMFDELMGIEGATEAVEWYEPKILPSKLKSMILATTISKESGFKALSDTPKVIVGTVHSVKGGAADLVYLSPDLGRAGGKEWRNLGKPEGRNAIVRSMYVGMTRAREGVALLGSTSQDRVEWI